MSAIANETEISLLQSPKSRAINLLRGLISRGGISEGERLPAEAKLAEQFDVSRETMRAALATLEQEGLVLRKKNVGCVRAGSKMPKVSTLMSRMIVLVTDLRAPEDGNSFTGTSEAIGSGVMDRLGKRSMNLLRLNSLDHEDDLWIDELIDSRPTGVIMCCWRRPHEWQLRILRRLRDGGVPVVSYGHSEAFDQFDSIQSDHRSGTEQLTRLLSSQGKQRILRLWTLPSHVGWIHSHNEGYDCAVRELGIPSVPAVYVEGGIPRINGDESNFRIRTRLFAGYLAEHLQGSEPIDAIMVSTDSEAIPVIAACRLFGRADVTVVGYDNYWRSIPERQWEPTPVTATIEKNNHRLGEELVELLMQRLDGSLPAGPQNRLVPQQLVIAS